MPVVEIRDRQSLVEQLLEPKVVTKWIAYITDMDGVNTLRKFLGKTSMRLTPRPQGKAMLMLRSVGQMQIFARAAGQIVRRNLANFPADLFVGHLAYKNKCRLRRNHHQAASPVGGWTLSSLKMSGELMTLNYKYGEITNDDDDNDDNDIGAAATVRILNADVLVPVPNRLPNPNTPLVACDPGQKNVATLVVVPPRARTTRGGRHSVLSVAQRSSGHLRPREKLALSSAGPPVRLDPAQQTEDELRELLQKNEQMKMKKWFFKIQRTKSEAAKLASVARYWVHTTSKETILPALLQGTLPGPDNTGKIPFGKWRRNYWEQGWNIDPKAFYGSFLHNLHRDNVVVIPTYEGYTSQTHVCQEGQHGSTRKTCVPRLLQCNSCGRAEDRDAIGARGVGESYRVARERNEQPHVYRDWRRRPQGDP